MILRRLPVLLAGLTAFIVLIVSAAVWAPHQAITTRIEIAATAGQVWSVLTDTGDYPAWSPSMRLSGILQPGQVIEHVEGQGADRVVFHPTVRIAAAGRELRWTARLWLPRLLDIEHDFRLQPAPGGTMLVQSERFHGVLLWLFDAQQLVPQFQAMNTALKTRVEAPNPFAR